ncbi:MAG: DNA polymerase III subunit delta' C-terminal domain-containing protein [Candidatus Omnitrophica bacterium]|nr:DNA polymerase III subunit delta' C-terminal domain-containing protein [Candidatus Omnitrophota bacterium]
MSFKEIIGQDHIINFLLSSYKTDKLCGAYVFIGKEGAGRSKLAKEFAKFINCENPSDDCCDVCESCKKIESEQHPDIHWFRPINNSVTIAQVRELEKYVYLMPYQAKKKFFIICDAQCLEEESSNALLKTLEEPTQDSIIILIVNDLSSLLATISSRCQKVIFNSLSETAIKDILIQKYKIPLLHAHFISYLSEGSPGKAMEFKDLREDLLEKRSHILNSVYFKKFSLFRMEEFSTKDNTQMRKNISLLLDMLLAWFRDLLVIKTGMNAPLINIDKKDDLNKLNSQYSAEELVKNIGIVSNTKYLVNSNINVKLALSKMRADLWK